MLDDLVDIPAVGASGWALQDLGSRKVADRPVKLGFQLLKRVHASLQAKVHW
jgi:hypothetical protein